MLDDEVPLKPGRGGARLAGRKKVPIALVTSTRTAKAEMLMQRTGLMRFLI